MTTLPPFRALPAYLALLTGLLCTFGLAAPPTSAPATAPATQTAPPPRTPGFHHLYYQGEIDGKPRTLAYSVYLPKNYDPGRRCPMLVYLVGLGDRGENHQGLFNNGPPVYLSTNQELSDWAPFIVLAPQCPADLRWETPGVAAMVRQLIDYASRTWAVDADRLYLTGLSNGGTGCWNIALEAPKKFAAIAVFCGMDADPKRMPQALEGTTTLIVCGSADGRFAVASHTMNEALRAAGNDVIFVEIPDGRHSIWQPFYADRSFYEFLLLHRRNGPAPATRPSTEDFLALSRKVANTADDQLARPLHKFLPWWFINNCGRSGTIGLKPRAFSREGVFVTTPMGKDVPCRLMYTAAIPAGQRTSLDLTVAAPYRGQWQLIVRANGQTLLKRIIGAGPTTNPATRPSTPFWVTSHVNLTPLAGQEVYLELLNAATDVALADAYWGEVKLSSTP